MSAESFLCRCLLGSADLPWSAVCGERGKDDQTERPWTVGPKAEENADQPGHWCTDTGCPRYGMPRRRAEMVAAVLNMVPTLLAQIEELEIRAEAKRRYSGLPEVKDDAATGPSPSVPLASLSPDLRAYVELQGQRMFMPNSVTEVDRLKLRAVGVFL